jgi:hypothetical protein
LFNNKDTETDFCESYKSQILSSKPDENENSLFSTILKSLSILILLAIIIGVSLYGYNYFINNKNTNNRTLPPASIQTFDNDLVVKMEEEIEPKEESIPIIKTPKIEEKIEPKEESVPIVKTPKIEETDIEEIANEVKIAIAKNEVAEENRTKEKEKILNEIKQVEENNSKEEESLEVPTSAPEAKYLEELADLSKEIDKERKK